MQELIQLVAQRREEKASFVQRRGQYEVEIAESRRAIASLQQQREQVNARLSGFMVEKEEQETEIAAREEELRVRRRRLTELQEQRGALEVELAQKNMSVQNLRQRVQEKYQLHLDDVRSECITINIASEGPAKVETLTPDEMAARGLATDWNVVADQVAALQKRIDEIGPVNLVAIEEYEETEQRYEFLTAQHDHLQAVVVVEVDVQVRQHLPAAVVLDPRQPPGQLVLVVIVDERDGAGHVARPLPLLLDELPADQVTQGLRAVGVLLLPDQEIKPVQERFFEGDPEANQFRHTKTPVSHFAAL